MFKALSSALLKLGSTDKEFSLLFLCKNSEVVKGKWDVPELKVERHVLESKVGCKLSDLKVELSISHESEYAVAFVVISK